MKKVVITFLVTAFFFSSALADISFSVNQDAEVIEFANDQTVAVKISPTDQSIIKVKNDKIKSIACAKEGYCVMRPISKERGDFTFGLGPNAKQGHPFSAFVETKDGRSFTMRIIPNIKELAKTVIFNPTTGGSKQAKKIEASTPYQAMLAKVITTMIIYPITKKNIDGYSYKKVPLDHDLKGIKVDDDLVVYLHAIFRGNDFVGIVSSVKNQTKRPLMINPRMFFKPGVLAGAVSAKELAPNEVGYSYQVFASNEVGK